ncbi:hypothetical protein DPMN_075469 [Dreissena polymorpha]|uniref:Uncharacterized protein n=1 Tax=Dreissena polymorpha TaxID=45954 RepID=A0A9D3YKF1_DREPO|nr:hypothetical protein DPMN_075469 [Dreissena polymorpha]
MYGVDTSHSTDVKINTDAEKQTRSDIQPDFKTDKSHVPDINFYANTDLRAGSDIKSDIYTDNRLSPDNYTDTKPTDPVSTSRLTPVLKIIIARYTDRNQHPTTDPVPYRLVRDDTLLSALI